MAIIGFFRVKHNLEVKSTQEKKKKVFYVSMCSLDEGMATHSVFLEISWAEESANTVHKLKESNMNEAT